MGISKNDVDRLMKANEDSETAYNEKNSKEIKAVFTVTVHWDESNGERFWQVYNLVAKDDLDARKKAIAICERDLKIEGTIDYNISFCEIEFGCVLDEL
jgi:hypothetical protein